ncbi:MAG: HAD family hydrolase [Pseudonocardiaceae bacterium]
MIAQLRWPSVRSVIATARTSPNPALLKPHLVTTALTALNVPTTAAAFVGDSVTDIHAARAAHIMSIGYANKPGKTAELMTAGADTVIHTPTELMTADADTVIRTPTTLRDQIM